MWQTPPKSAINIDDQIELLTKTLSKLTIKLPCDKCSFAAKSKHGLTQHVKRVHSELESKIRCEFCDKTYTTLSALARHTKMKHKNVEI